MGANDTGIIGWPVSHSLSPLIQNRWRQQYGVGGSYELMPIEPEHLVEKIKKTKASGLRGFNVTVPHKESIIPFLDTVDDIAHHIGAVNTVVREGSTWRGTNTDAYGFITALKKSTTASAKQDLLKNVLVLGAGGSCRAVIVALQEAGAESITLTNRTKEKADALAAEFGVKSLPWEDKEGFLRKTTLLVNTTVLGMVGHPPLVLSLNQLNPSAVVYDLVYAPTPTEIVRQARSKHIFALNGLGMLIYQAQRAFEEWHGVLPQVEEALTALLMTEIQKRKNL